MFQSFDARAIGLTLPFEEALQLAAAYDFVRLELPLDEVVERARTSSIQQVKACQTFNFALQIEELCNLDCT
jgi:hypothetical protein